MEKRAIKIIVLVFGLLIIVVIAGQLFWRRPAKKRLPLDSLPYLHGYATFSKISDLPLEELSSYTNFILSKHEVRKDLPSEEDLQRLRESGMKLLLKLDKTIVEEKFDEAELKRLKNRLDEYKDVILAIYPIDEPYKPKKEYNEDQLRELVQKVKNIFPDYSIYVNFLNPNFVKSQRGYYPDIPDNIDFISIDIYLSYPENEKERYKEMIGKSLSLIKEKAGSRPVFFASKGFGPVDEPTKKPTTYQMEWDYELFLEYDLIGLGWYFYEDTSPGGQSYGSSHYPEIIEKQKEIGKRLLLL